MSLSALATTLRSLSLRPGYALTVIATLALGIGAATAVFALVNGIVLGALPYPNADRLVLIRESSAGGSTWNTSTVDLNATRELASSFDAVAAMRNGDALVGAGENATWLKARYVSANYFDLLGVRPERGRGFAPGDDAASAAPSVVIGAALAEREFAGRDPVGRSILIDGESHVVAGVMPAGAEQWPAMRADVWPILKLAAPTRRGPFFLSTIARMKSGVTLERATEDLDAVSRRIFPLWQKGFQDEKARLKPFALRDQVIAGAADFIWLAFGAVGVVLLIALVNNANLMLMRIAQRAHDLGVRAALGASRWRLARMLIGENLVLVTLGAGAGVALAATLLAQYRALAAPAVPRLAEVTMGWPVLAFAAALAVLSSIALALLPFALGAVGAAGGATKSARGASAGRDPQRVRDALVVLEFALALPLLLAAGLLVDSLARLRRVDPGFDPHGVLTASVRLPAQRYADANAQIAFWQRALPELRALPGVRGAALVGAPPPSCGCTNNFDIVGRPAPNGAQPASEWLTADAALFATLGVPLRDGRVFDERDTADSPRVIVVTESWARRFFSDARAVGQRVLEGGGDVPVEIVGVVGDVKYDGLEQPGETVFAPVSQGSGGGALTLVMRTNGEALAIATDMRGALRRLDQELVPKDLATLDTLLSDAVGGQRHWAAVIAGFALAAVLLAAVGVFGVLAYHVANRRREIGIRQALGAGRREILALVLGRGLRCAALGIAIGSVLAAFATRGLDALLFEVTRADPLAWIGAIAALLAVAAAACWLPARRAVAIDPQVALREE